MCCNNVQQRNTKGPSMAPGVFPELQTPPLPPGWYTSYTLARGTIHGGRLLYLQGQRWRSGASRCRATPAGSWGVTLTRSALTILNGHEATSRQPACCHLEFVNHFLQDPGHGSQTTAPHPGHWSNKEQGLWQCCQACAEWEAPSLRTKAPSLTTKAPPAPQATEPEVLSTSEKRRPLLSPELPPAGSTLSISRSRWPEKPSPRSVCWSHPRLAKRWPAGQIWPTDVFSLASTMLDHFLEPTFNNLEIPVFFS